MAFGHRFDWLNISIQHRAVSTGRSVASNEIVPHPFVLLVAMGAVMPILSIEGLSAELPRQPQARERLPAS